MTKLLTLLLIALSVGLDSFAAAVAIGLGGAAKSVRYRTAFIFGLFGTGAPVIGLALGHQVASKLGGHANLIGGGLLVLTGLYLTIAAIRKVDDKDVKEADQSWGKLLLIGVSVSIDNLIIGFSLGTRHQSLITSTIAIGIAVVGLTLLGLELGSKLSKKAEQYSELLSGLILLIVGILLGLKIL
jgi:putative Mn2+ efflux pump MntP